MCGKKKAESSPTNRPKNFKPWFNEFMLQAIAEVRDATMSANMAGRTYKVPQFTLKDRISGRIRHGTKPGPISCLGLSFDTMATSVRNTVNVRYIYCYNQMFSSFILI